MKFAKQCFVVVGLFLAFLSSASANLITNGTFHSGNLDGWTVFKTTNGLTKASVKTGTSGTRSARFNVGEVTYTGKLAGGGIRQSFTSGEGIIDMSADIGVYSEAFNREAGIFSMLLDHVVVARYDFGRVQADQSLINTLAYTGAIGAGVHELRFLITRPYLSLATTPRQYIDNVVVTMAVPEPGTVALLCLGLIAVAVLRRQSSRS